MNLKVDSPVYFSRDFRKFIFFSYSQQEDIHKSKKAGEQDSKE